MGVDMRSIFNEKIQRGDMMHGFDEKLDLAGNAKASDIDNPHISETFDWNFELFVEEYVRENLLDFVDDVLCGVI